MPQKINQDHVKLILGIKLRELRVEKGISLSALSKETGISHSYLNEIEKGKKYPKKDKIETLAAALGTTSDELVSLKLNNKLQPLANLLQSNFLTEIPFDFFGVEPSSLLSLMAEAPDKLGAFINAIINIGRNYNMSVENFHHAALRSYQEMHNNYFPEIEKSATSFLLDHDLTDKLPTEKKLLEILKSKYGIDVVLFDDEDYPILGKMRSVYKHKTKQLLINKKISQKQRVYSLAKEIAFHYMGLTARTYASQPINDESFEEVLSNFRASYFASAVILPQEPFVRDIKNLFSRASWDVPFIESLIDTYDCTPETFFYRVSNVLPEFFGIKTMFFMRFESIAYSNEYWLTKEMHLERRLGPQEKVEEHYCRRWVSIGILEHLSFKQSIGKYVKPLIECQKSYLKENKTHYFVMSMARPLNIEQQKNVSVNLGFEITEEVMNKITYLSDENIPAMEVNQTCERCSIFDCQERQTAPIVLQANRRKKEIKRVLSEIS